MSAGRWLHHQIIQVETGDVIKHKPLLNQAATDSELKLAIIIGFLLFLAGLLDLLAYRPI
jgi:hypothetical protein